MHIDENCVGSIRHRETGCFNTEPGVHLVRVSIEAFFGSSTVECEIAVGETCTYLCRGRTSTERLNDGVFRAMRIDCYLVLGHLE